MGMGCFLGLRPKTVVKYVGLSVMSLTLQLSRSAVIHSSEHFLSARKSIDVDKFVSRSSSRLSSVVVVLSGSGGLKSRNWPYRSEAMELAERGYEVYLLHYTDATNGAVSNPDSKYSIWVRVVNDAITSITSTARTRVILVGYSLGASVALAEASQDTRVTGVVSWSGSMPDEYATRTTTLPPLLILHGENDTVIPVGDAEQLTRLCGRLGTRCEFRPFSGESHSFSPSAISTANEIMWRFLESLSSRRDQAPEP